MKNPSGRHGKEAGMAEQDEILVVSPSDRKPGPSTPGMERQQAVATNSMWSGVARRPAWCPVGIITVSTRRQSMSLLVHC
jgi:hypothetical protein